MRIKKKKTEREEQIKRERERERERMIYRRNENKTLLEECIKIEMGRGGLVCGTQAATSL